MSAPPKGGDTCGKKQNAQADTKPQRARIFRAFESCVYAPWRSDTALSPRSARTPCGVSQSALVPWPEEGHTDAHMGPASSFGAGGAQRPLTSDTLRIREVWADNLEEEMAVINHVVEEFPYLAMDTEFPGVVRTTGTHTEAHAHCAVNTGSQGSGQLPSKCAAARRVVFAGRTARARAQRRGTSHRLPDRWARSRRQGSTSTRRCAATWTC